MNYSHKKNARRHRPSSAKSLRRTRQRATNLSYSRKNSRLLGNNTYGVTIEQYKIAARILSSQDSDEIDAAVYTLERLAAKSGSNS